MDLKYTIYEKKGRLAYVTMNRPEVRNALNSGANLEMTRVWQDFSDDPELWVAILTGAGDKAFSSGHDARDIAEAQDPRSLRRSRRGREAAGFGGLTHNEVYKPIVAAVNGHALGGGMELAMACDIIIAAEHATFGLIHVRVGVIAAAGGLYRLPRQVPLKLAMEMLLTGKTITAQEACRIGLVNKVVPLAELMPEATRMAELICENAPLAVQVTKELAIKGLELPLYPSRAWDLEHGIAEEVYASEDMTEGARAFLEKRKPVWKGR